MTNYQPKFSFTLPLINQLTVIERLYGQLLGEKLIPSLALKLSQDNQILATHHSTSIEGNPLSPKDIYLTNRFTFSLNSSYIALSPRLSINEPDP